MITHGPSSAISVYPLLCSAPPQTAPAAPSRCCKVGWSVCEREKGREKVRERERGRNLVPETENDLPGQRPRDPSLENSVPEYDLPKPQI